MNAPELIREPHIADPDSFYEELSKRISQLQEANLPDDWTGIVINTTA
jgi:hypothetical protein